MRNKILHILLISIIILSLTGLTHSELSFNKEHLSYTTLLEQIEDNSGNLIAYYSLNEISDTTLFDHSQNNHNATIYGATAGATGINGNAYTFDGTNDYMSVPSNTDFDFLETEDFSVFLWIKKDGNCDSVAGNSNEVIIQRGPWWFGCAGVGETNENQLQLELAPSGVHITLYSQTLINDSQWHHIGWTYDGSTNNAKLYVNGKIESDNTTAFTGGFNGIYPLCIGNWGSTDCLGGSYYYDGEIDEIRIYDKVISEQEAGQLYSQKAGFFLKTTLPQQKPACDTNTIGLYHFDDTALENCNSHHLQFYSSALRFDGTNDCINVSALDVTNNKNALTISAWVMVDDFGNANSFYASSINNGGVPSSLSRAQISIGTTGRIQIAGRSTDAESIAQFTSTRAIIALKWYHIAGILDYENNEGRIFINGIEDTVTRTGLATFGSTTTPATDSASSSIGAEDACTTSNPFDGIIDELKIYDGALSNEDIYKLYKNQPIDNNNLILYYPFNDLSGTTLTDHSGNGGDGTLLNFASTAALYGDSNSAGWTSSQIKPPYAKGKFGNAIKLNKGDALIDAYNSDFDLQTFTISGWFKADSISSQYSTILSKSLSTTNRNFAIYINDTTNYLIADLSSGGTYYETRYETPIETKQWYYFTFTHSENGFAKLYINGNLVDSTYTGGYANTPNDALTMGGRTGSDFFNGTIDELKISSEVLSSDKIMHNYLNGKAEHTTIDLGTKKIISDISWSEHKPLSPIDINYPNLVGYWKFDGNYKDSSGHASEGSLNGASSYFTNDAKENQAFAFRGTTNYIEITEYPEIDITSGENFTISVWVKTTQQAAASLWPVIVKHEYNSGSRQGYNLMTHLDDTDARWFLEIYVAGTDYKVFGNSDIADGKWHHLVAMRKGTQLITYEDGEYAGTTNAVSSSISISGALRIGGHDNAVGDFIGNIDELAFYDKALEEDEVKNLYESSKIYIQMQTSDDDYEYTKITGNQLVPYEYEENKTLLKLPFNNNLKGYDNEYPITQSIYDKEGLIGYWNFDNNMKDLSGNNNDIAIWNDGVERKKTSMGTSLYFDTLDNNGAAIIPFDETFDVDKNTSISYFLWFKKETDCNSPEATRENEVMLNRWGQADLDSNWWFGCFGSTDKLHIEMYPTPSTMTALDSPQIIDDGDWHLGGWSLDGITNNLSLYLDGVVVNSTIITTFSDNLKTVNPICIGAYGYSGGASYCANYEYNGYLDEISIWKKALTEEEAYALYEETAFKYGKFLSGKEISGSTNLIYPVGSSIDENTVLNCKFEDGVLCDTGQKGEIIIDYSNIEGLTGYWKLDRDATDSVNSNDGTANSISYMKDSYSKTSAHFDGYNDYITIPASTDLDFDSNDGFSFFLWVKNNGICDSPETNQNEVFASREGETAGDDWWLGCKGDNQALRINFEATGGMRVDGITLMNNTNWYHIGWTYDGSTKTLSLYSNGELEGSVTNISYTGNYSSAENLCIGGYGAGSCQFYDFNGNIDDIITFNKALSLTEIQDLYTISEGKYGEAFKTNKKQYIKMDFDESLKIEKEDFTVMAWVKTGDSSTINTIISSRDKSFASGGKGFDLYINSGYFRSSISDGDSGDYQTPNSGTDISDNNWHHVAVTFDRDGNMVQYVDGVKKKTTDITSITGDISQNIYPLFIGSSEGNSIFNGSIDEVKIVKGKAFSEQEIYNEFLGNIKSDQGTISFMLKPNWNGNDNTAHTFFDEGSFKIYKDTSNDFNFQILNQKATFDMSTAQADTWYRIDTTWNSSSLDVYVDGVHQDSTLMPSATINLTSYMFIGNSMEQDETCDCIIDDFNIFNYAKTSAQINPTGFTNSSYASINTSARFIKFKSIFETSSHLISPAISYFTINNSVGIQYTEPTPEDNSNMNANQITINVTFSYSDVTSCTLNYDGSNYPMDLNSGYCNYTISSVPENIASSQFNVSYVRSLQTYYLDTITINFYPDLSQNDVPFGNLIIYVLALLTIIGGISIKK